MTDNNIFIQFFTEEPEDNYLGEDMHVLPWLSVQWINKQHWFDKSRDTYSVISFSFETNEIDLSAWCPPPLHLRPGAPVEVGAQGKLPQLTPFLWPGLPGDTKSWCLAFIPMVWHSIFQRCLHVEIWPNSKEGTTWLMWSPLQNEVFGTLWNFPDHVRKGQMLPNSAVWCWFQLFGTQFARDIHTSKFGTIAKVGSHEPCGSPHFAKWGFYNPSKLSWSCQERPQAPKSFFLVFIPTFSHTCFDDGWPYLKQVCKYCIL